MASTAEVVRNEARSSQDGLAFVASFDEGGNIDSEADLALYERGLAEKAHQEVQADKDWRAAIGSRAIIVEETGFDYIGFGREVEQGNYELGNSRQAMSEKRKLLMKYGLPAATVKGGDAVELGRAQPGRISRIFDDRVKRYETKYKGLA